MCKNVISILHEVHFKVKLVAFKKRCKSRHCSSGFVKLNSFVGNGQEIPRFLVEPSETNAVENDIQTIIACSTTGIPAPTIVSWLKNGELLPLGGTKSIIAPGNLRLGRVSRTDDGYYQCVAQNSFASVISKRAKLNVACKLQIFQ